MNYYELKFRDESKLGSIDRNEILLFELRIIVYLSFDIFIASIRDVLSYLLYESSFEISKFSKCREIGELLRLCSISSKFIRPILKFAVSDIYISLHVHWKDN